MRRRITPLATPIARAKECFSAMFNTNKTLEQKVKASMATSLHREFIEHYIIIRLSDPHIFIAELTPLHCQDSHPHAKLR